MGEISDMLLSGEMCEQCGYIFSGEIGRPRICHDCKEENKREESKNE